MYQLRRPVPGIQNVFLVPGLWLNMVKLNRGYQLVLRPVYNKRVDFVECLIVHMKQIKREIV